ncbi:glutaminase A [Salmonella enterica]|nr:glutaminase A [Salmonella enterica]
MKCSAIAASLSVGLLLSMSASATGSANYSDVVNQAWQKFKDDNSGKVADYIPALAKYSAGNYAIALATVDGKLYLAGNTGQKFPLESLTKIFTLAMVLNQYGSDEVLNKLGANATGLPFNSGLAIELRSDRLQNPLVNAGAISTVSLVKAKDADARWQTIISNMDAFADSHLNVNQDVYRSESATNQHNQALGRLMLSYRRIYSNVDEAVDLYTRQCSVEATTVQLAKMGAVLANGGRSPFNGRQLLPARYVPGVLSEMVIAGLYDDSGKWLYSVGLPAKSGVGGGMVAVVPGQYAVAVYSPPLDPQGNSVRAQEAIRYIANETGSSLWQPH